MNQLVEQWLPQLLARPADDAPRLVLADLLIERGDPLGDFIRLQIENKNGAPSFANRGRAFNLLKTNRDAWLPRGVDPESAKFERGFLHHARLVGATDPMHFAWHFVKDLELELPTGDGRSLPFAALDSIDRVTGLNSVSLEPFLRACGQRVRELSVALSTPLGPKVVEAVSVAEGLRRVWFEAASMPVEPEAIRELVQRNPRFQRVGLPRVSDRVRLDHLVQHLAQHAPRMILFVDLARDARGRIVVELTPARDKPHMLALGEYDHLFRDAMIRLSNDVRAEPSWEFQSPQTVERVGIEQGLVTALR